MKRKNWLTLMSGCTLGTAIGILVKYVLHEFGEYGYTNGEFGYQPVISELTLHGLVLFVPIFITMLLYYIVEKDSKFKNLFIAGLLSSLTSTLIYVLINYDKYILRAENGAVGGWGIIITIATLISCAIFAGIFAILPDKSGKSKIAEDTIDK